MVLKLLFDQIKLMNDFLLHLLAQSTIELDENIGLQEVRLTFFPQPDFAVGEFSILSWLSFIGGIATVGLIAYWIFLILAASFSALQSSGEAEGLAESYNKLKSTFIGAGLAFLFPLALTLVGVIMGLGPFWTWPKAFQRCESSQYTFYYQALLAEEVDNTREVAAVQAEDICGYNN